MKLFLILSLIMLLASSCNCGNEDEDFTPYPGGKSSEVMPRK